MIDFLQENSAKARFLRTLIQALIALAISALSYFEGSLPDWFNVLIVPFIMCLLSPIMSSIKKIDEEGEEDADE